MYACKHFGNALTHAKFSSSYAHITGSYHLYNHMMPSSDRCLIFTFRFQTKKLRTKCLNATLFVLNWVNYTTQQRRSSKYTRRQMLLRHLIRYSTSWAAACPKTSKSSIKSSSSKFMRLSSAPVDSNEPSTYQRIYLCTPWTLWTYFQR